MELTKWESGKSNDRIRGDVINREYRAVSIAASAAMHHQCHPPHSKPS